MSDSPSPITPGRTPPRFPHEISKSNPGSAATSFLSEPADEVSTRQGSKTGNIKVVCRFRPINEKERVMNLGTCVDFSPDGTQVIVNSVSEGNGPLKFNFDHIFPPNTAQAAVYEAAAKPIVESVLEGFNGTVFAYGQTGSGKTFTMAGANIDDENLKGIIPRMITTVFSALLTADEHLEFTVKIGYCEIYMEKIKDLLNPAKNNLKVHEDKSRGVYIQDLTEEYVSVEEEVYNLMKIGTANREVAATQMNEGSSRSHSLFIMTICQNNTLDFSMKTGKLYLVDLAGSEKVGKTGAEGKRLDEAKTINKSLSTLGLVIYSLTDGKSTHIPYRDSKLTRVLQDSLGGNSKTSLIITCSPSPYNEAETVSTLRFGIRAKQIKNKPKVNKEYTVAELKLLLSKAEAEIAKRDRKIEVLEKAILDAGLQIPTDDALGERDESDHEEHAALIPPPEMEEMRQELEDTQQKLSEQAENTEEYRLKYTDVSSKVQALLKQREEMQEQMNRLLHTLNQLDERNQDLEEQVQKTTLMQETQQQKINNFVSEKLQLENKVTELETELERLNSESAVSLTQFRSGAIPRSSITRMNDEIGSKDEEIRDLKSRLETKEAVLTHIAVMSKETKVQSLIQQSQDLNVSQLLGVQQLYEQEKEKNERLAQEFNQLKADLEQAMKTKGANLEEFLARIKQEEAAEMNKKLSELQSSHQRDMSLATQKNQHLLQDLEFEQTNYRNLENAMSEGERMLKKKVNKLEENLEQLTHLYHQLANDKSVLKVEFQVVEKKTKRKDETIAKLQAELEKTRKELKEARFIEASSMMESGVMSAAPLRSSRSGYKIKKTIRGGKHSDIRNLGLHAPLTKLNTFTPGMKGLTSEGAIEESSLEEERKD